MTTCPGGSWPFVFYVLYPRSTSILVIYVQSNSSFDVVGHACHLSKIKQSRTLDVRVAHPIHNLAIPTILGHEKLLVFLATGQGRRK